MKKSVIKGWGLAAAACLLALSAALPVHAAPASYEYRVCIHAGVQGTFADGSTVKEYKGEDGVVSVTFDWEEEVVLPEESRYYVKGIKESGSEKMENSSFTVAEDRDYVVVYGVRGDNMVKYAIHYVDEAGNHLADSKYYEGAVGDMPIVGHLPIDGYVPQAYNLTRTLQKEEEKNEFTFVYRRAETAAAGEGGGTIEEVETTTNTETVVVPGAGTGAGGDGGNGDVTVIDGGAAGAAGAGGAAGAAGAGETAEAGAGEEAEEGPAELINLDDEETPLAGPGGQNKVPENAAGAGSLFRMPPAVMTGIVSAVVLFAAAVYFLMGKRKKKETDKGTDEDA